MAMIRPRTGDFLYLDQEMDVMLEDVRVFKECGVQGIVIGILREDGRVDVGQMKRVADAALPLEVCFHRAFDMTRDVNEALRDIKSIGGISRILTSGQGKSVPGALPTLESLFRATRALIENEPCGLTILPGSGINPQTVGPILDSLLPLGLQEIHLSGGHWKEGGMSFKREGMGMGTGGAGDWGVWVTDAQIVREVREIVDARWELHTRGARGD
ncbi:copper homeostasis protein cutC [Lyophyllum atratum]|nr:copper homeostasis protein cutC [Lyophyllum atratum]